MLRSAHLSPTGLAMDIEAARNTLEQASLASLAVGLAIGFSSASIRSRSPQSPFRSRT